MCGRHCTSISPHLTDLRAHRPHCQAGGSELQREVDFGLSLIKDHRGIEEGRVPQTPDEALCSAPLESLGPLQGKTPKFLVYAKDTQEAVQAGLARYLLNSVGHLRPEVPHHEEAMAALTELPSRTP